MMIAPDFHCTKNSEPKPLLDYTLGALLGIGGALSGTLAGAGRSFSWLSSCAQHLHGTEQSYWDADTFPLKWKGSGMVLSCHFY